MHRADVKEVVATGAAGLVIELGYIPSYAKIVNTVTGKFAEYLNPSAGLSKQALATSVVSVVFEDGTYLLNGVKATDSKLRKTDPGSTGVVAPTGAGLILDDITDINDADELTSNSGGAAILVVIALRGDL